MDTCVWYCTLTWGLVICVLWFSQLCIGAPHHNYNTLYLSQISSNCCGRGGRRRTCFYIRTLLYTDLKKIKQCNNLLLQCCIQFLYKYCNSNNRNTYKLLDYFYFPCVCKLWVKLLQGKEDNGSYGRTTLDVTSYTWSCTVPIVPQYNYSYHLIDGYINEKYSQEHPKTSKFIPRKLNTTIIFYH